MRFHLLMIVLSQSLLVQSLRPLASSLRTSSHLSSMASPENVGQGDIGQSTTTSTPLPKDLSWRQLLQISSDTSRSIKGSNYVQLATVDPTTQTPRNRCCVFRGFQTLPDQHPLAHTYYDNQPCLMRMTTDDRSGKVSQAQTVAEMVWWFPHSNEQYRLRGPLLFVGGQGSYPYDDDEFLQQARLDQWEAQTDAARESFLRRDMPGSPWTPRDYEIPAGGRDAEGNIVPPPDAFLLMYLQPQYVDYLRLTDLYRQVDEFKDNKWSREVVNY